LYRNWAEHSEWIRAAIKHLKTQISTAKWDIVPFDADVRRDNVRLQTRIKALLDRPNDETDSFRALIEPIIEDILVLDAGVIEKVRSVRDEVSALYKTDGGQIKVNALWDGDPEEPRYYWYVDGREMARLLNRDMLYIMANPRTYSPVGLSPLETLKQTIDAELKGSDYNYRQVVEAAPDGVFDLGEGANDSSVEKFESYWKAEVAGRGMLGFIGGTKGAKFIPFRSTNHDMQFMEWQVYLVRKICAVFGVSPQDLGVTFDINRATGEVQQELSEDRATRPLMGLLQEYITREIVWDEGFGGPANNLAFRFTALNLEETLNKAKLNQLALAGVPWKTINEARKEDGREPFGPEYDELMLKDPNGVVRLTDVPTAREVLDAKKKAPPADAAPSGGPPPSAS
jgi:phage portal protein BeeE